MSESDPERVEHELSKAIELLPLHLRKAAELLSFPVLHSACMEGELHLVSALLDLGVPPDLYPETDDDDDEPPLTWLARNRANAAPNALQIAALLIERCEDVDEGHALLAALEADDVSMSRLLLAAGADPEQARNDAGPMQVALLDALMQPYWRVAVGLEPRYFIAYDEDQAICGVGLSEEDAAAAAQSELGRPAHGVSLANERLVATILAGEEVSWVEKDGVAQLEDS